jgi:hypothetical protein
MVQGLILIINASEAERDTINEPWEPCLSAEAEKEVEVQSFFIIN